ncbi:membrane protein (plasmid) [Fulvitalea axinellae]|uniref:Membrane protein n=1 Tax=Fulvitalea axinellae TaxID=1182444 RepID=A0AAU9CSV0_9BACT|nr:membrane protein [Fulvitalea axinellae]
MKKNKNLIKIAFVSFGLFTTSGALGQTKKEDDEQYKVEVHTKEERQAMKKLRKENLSLIERTVNSPDSLKVKRNMRLLPLPVIFSSPEVGLALGANLQGYWHHNRDLRNQQSTAMATAIYTIYGQYSFRSMWDMSMGQDNWRLRGQANYSYFPLNYYGIGDEKNDPEQAKEYISQTYAQFWAEGLRRISDGWFVGASIDYANLFDAYSTDEDGDRLEDPTESIFYGAPGSEGYQVLGLGPRLIYDSRDNIRFPANGSYFEVSSSYYFGDMNFANVTLDLRKYWQLKPGHYFAAQTYLNGNFGDVPYDKMPGFGQTFGTSLSVGRGFYPGRYRDKNLYYTQVEYRYPIYGSIRGVVFGGMGNVTDEFTDPNFSTMKFNYGAGLRVPFDKKGKVYLRADVAASPNEPVGFYLRMGEAF